MGYKKLSERERISGHHVPLDIQDGTHSPDELSKRAAARQDEIGAKHKADWEASRLGQEKSDPILADAMSKVARPSDVSSKGGDYYGASEGTPLASPGKDLNARPAAPDSNSKASK